MKYRILGSLALFAASCYATPVEVWVDDANGNIGEVNVATGGVTMVGSAGVQLTDMAFTANGALYGISYNSFYGINTSTGQATLIGALGDSTTANSLTFGPNGTLYTADLVNLYTIDLSTGFANYVGPMGYSSGGGLAFVNGTLYLATLSNQLATVNPTTGTATVVGNLGALNIYGLAAVGSTLYGFGGANGEDVYSINLSTGAATYISTWAGSGLGVAYGAAYDPLSLDNNPIPDPPTVPEPATFALFGIGCLLLGLGFRLRSMTAGAPIGETGEAQPAQR